MFDFIETIVRLLVTSIVKCLPVKVIRDERGTPFLYRYHLFSFGKNGPGVCIHHFVKSDPDRGYHDHPWSKSLSFILCGGYEERILEGYKKKPTFKTIMRKRWRFNYLKGVDVYHRVIIDEGKDAWSIFFFQRRSKRWGMMSLDGKYTQMSKTVEDQDGGWWKEAPKGAIVENHILHPGNVTATVDVIVLKGASVLLIKRGKMPFRGMWAFPGGRIEYKDDDIKAAALRELKEETNLEVKNIRHIKTVGTNSRDPRGFYLTNVFMTELFNEPKIKAGDDAVDYRWFPLDELPTMAFDHADILHDVLVKNLVMNKEKLVSE